jgi:hypothetical protein
MMRCSPLGHEADPMNRQRLSFVAVLVALPLIAGVSSVTASPSTAPKVGRACKVAGQIVGTAPSQLICQRSPKKALLWTRVPSSSVSSTPAGSAPRSAPTFLSRPSPTSAPAAVALFNEQGKNGYAYLGPFFVGAASHEVFVKAETGTTYTYDVVEKAPDASTGNGLLGRLSAKGREGYIYKGPAFFGADFSTSYLIFVKSSAKKTTYSYRSTSWPTEEPAMVSDLNTNGAAGFAYLGDLVPDPAQANVGVRLFVKDDKATTTFSYATKPHLVDRGQLLAEIVAAGAAKATWQGGYVFGAGTNALQTRTLYETSSSTIKPTSCSFLSPVPTSIDAVISSANENAAKGDIFWGQYQVGTDIVTISCTSLPATLPLIGVVLP